MSIDESAKRRCICTIIYTPNDETSVHDPGRKTWKVCHTEILSVSLNSEGKINAQYSTFSDGYCNNHTTNINALITDLSLKLSD